MISVPTQRLTRGMSSDAVLSSSPSRDKSEAMVARLMSASRGGSEGGKSSAGKGDSFGGERPRRFSLGKGSSFLRSEPVACGGDSIKPSSPTRTADRPAKGAAGREAEGLAAAASAEAAIALVGTAEPRHGKNEWGKADAAGHAHAVRVALNTVAAAAGARCSDVETVDKNAGGSAEVRLESSSASEESVFGKPSVAVERVSTESKGESTAGGGGGSGSGSGDEQGGAANQTRVVVEDVVIDPKDLTFFYSSGHALRSRNDSAARRTVAAARKVW